MQMTIISTIVGKNPIEEMEYSPYSQQKGLKSSTWVQSKKTTEWSLFFSKADHSLSQ